MKSIQAIPPITDMTTMQQERLLLLWLLKSIPGSHGILRRHGMF
jgi:hypothetical protein